jgi:hypothetical protein
LSDQWQITGQAVRSRTDVQNASALPGSAYQTHLSRIGRQFQYEAIYNALSPQFESLTGFIPRTDYRSLENLGHYYFRPEKRLLVAWGPEFDLLQSWDFSGTRLDSSIHPSVYVELQRRTFLRVHYFDDRSRLRPVDFPVLPENTDFATPKWRLDVASSIWNRGTVDLQFLRGKDINFFPSEGQLPSQSQLSSISASFVVRAMRNLQFRNNYLFTGLRTPENATIFNDHIIRTRATYQFTRELSLRVIVQYEATLTNPALTSLEDRRNLNADVLVTYLLNPWTALYVGYNGNRQNYAWIQEEEGPRLVRTKDGFINDANQFFLKFSYLFRF